MHRTRQVLVAAASTQSVTTKLDVYDWLGEDSDMHTRDQSPNTRHQDVTDKELAELQAACGQLSRLDGNHGAIASAIADVSSRLHGLSRKLDQILSQ